MLLEDELYYRTIDGILLRCLGGDEAKNLMGEIHEGVCGAHQSAFKMKIVLSILRGVKDVRNLAMFKGHLHRP